MGRPRKFDEAATRERVMHLFWEKGFDGTSLDDVVAATGLNRPSLYNAFGDKHALFQAALEQYRATCGTKVIEPLFARRGKEALFAFLDALSTFVSTEHGRRGCLLVNTSLENVAERDEVAALLGSHFASLESGLAKACRYAARHDELDARFTARGMADWLATITRGILVGAASGVGPEHLRRSIRTTKVALG